MALDGSKVFVTRDVDDNLKLMFGNTSLLKTNVLSLKLCGEKKEKKKVFTE